MTTWLKLWCFAPPICSGAPSISYTLSPVGLKKGFLISSFLVSLMLSSAQKLSVLGQLIIMGLPSQRSRPPLT